ncbi:MAG: lysozyme inhibitor LprI family protein [Roseiarcus sp.]|jgi:hypothetical protein
MPRRVVRRRSPIAAAALLAVLTLAAPPAGADIPGQPAAADVALVDSCLAQAAAAKTDADACIGRVEAACAAEAATAAAKRQCSNREYLVWNVALDRDYLRLFAMVADEAAKRALREAEREFAIVKLKRCTFERIARGNSPDALIAASRCEVQATARQDLWLREQVDLLKSP